MERGTRIEPRRCEEDAVAASLAGTRAGGESKGERSKMPTDTKNLQDLLAIVNQEEGGEEKKT